MPIIGAFQFGALREDKNPRDLRPRMLEHRPYSRRLGGTSQSPYLFVFFQSKWPADFTLGPKGRSTEFVLSEGWAFRQLLVNSRGRWQVGAGAARLPRALEVRLGQRTAAQYEIGPLGD